MKLGGRGRQLQGEDDFVQPKASQLGLCSSKVRDIQPTNRWHLVALTPQMCGITGQSNRKSVLNSLLTVGILQCSILCPLPVPPVYLLILIPPGLTSTLCNFPKKRTLFWGFLTGEVGWGRGQIFWGFSFYVKVESAYSHMPLEN